MKYDIFISYRRKESSGRSNVPMARTFKLEFERRGYKVFFDYSECTDNYFSETILPAIRTCDYFVLILTEDCMSRCFNEGDWVRREIEEALANNRKIIPITPDKECSAWPNLPDSLKKLDGLQITTIYTDHMFEDCVGFLVKNRFHLDGNGPLGNERQKAEQERKASANKQNNTRPETTKSFNRHEYVDLGLPSGTLWAICNIGANKPDEYGEYISWDKSKATAAKLGNDWCLPTQEQFEELRQNTTSSWTNRNGVKGRLFMANNGNSLFLPASGGRWLIEGELQYVGVNGIYWSDTLISDNSTRAWSFLFSKDSCDMNSNARFIRLSVRLVCSSK